MIPNLTQVQASIVATYPKWKIVSKSNSIFMKILGFFMGTNFTNNYVTTIGYTTYTPVGFDALKVETQCECLRHEAIHLGQYKKLNVLYVLAYLLFPLPILLSYCRAKWEFEAYTESMRADNDYGLDITNADYQNWILQQFTTSAYGWMFPFKKTVQGWITKAAQEITK